MLIFHCTKDATEALSCLRGGNTHTWISAEAPAVADGDAPWHWQLHAASIARKRVLIAMQADSRFVLLLWGIKKGDGEAVLQQLLERLYNHAHSYGERFGLLSEADTDAALQRMLTAQRRFAFVAGGTDRSVQAHINDVLQQTKWQAQHYGVPADAAEAAAWEQALNDTLRSRRGGAYFHPDVTWYGDWLRSYAAADEQTLVTLEQRRVELLRQPLANLLDSPAAGPMDNGALRDDELARLDELLAAAGAQSMNLEMLDGFFCALICGPQLVLPSTYLTLVWGEEPCFPSVAQGSETLSLLLRHWNFIASTLLATQTGGTDYVPLLYQDEDGSVRGNEWAAGFLLGMLQWEEDWDEQPGGEECSLLLTPVIVLAHEHHPDPKLRPPKLKAAERRQLIDGLALALAPLYQHFAAQRRGEAPAAPPQRRSSPKVGRNDPCPCGSGRKYKQCCGSGAPTQH